MVKFAGNPHVGISISKSEAERLLKDPEHRDRVMSYDELQNLILEFKKVEYEAAAQFGIEPDHWDNMDHRARYNAPSGFSAGENALYQAIIIRAGELAYMKRKSYR